MFVEVPQEPRAAMIILLTSRTPSSAAIPPPRATLLEAHLLIKSSPVGSRDSQRSYNRSDQHRAETLNTRDGKGRDTGDGTLAHGRIGINQTPSEVCCICLSALGCNYHCTTQLHKFDFLPLACLGTSLRLLQDELPFLQQAQTLLVIRKHSTTGKAHMPQHINFFWIAMVLSSNLAWLLPASFSATSPCRSLNLFWDHIIAGSFHAAVADREAESCEYSHQGRTIEPLPSGIKSLLVPLQTAASPRTPITTACSVGSNLQVQELFQRFSRRLMAISGYF